jgi:hypothetical protein
MGSVGRTWSENKRKRWPSWNYVLILGTYEIYTFPVNIYLFTYTYIPCEWVSVIDTIWDWYYEEIKEGLKNKVIF